MIPEEGLERVKDGGRGPDEWVEELGYPEDGLDIEEGIGCCPGKGAPAKEPGPG
ncbi:MAG TPA: hypothetical protein VHK67_06745 [Rhabdochlamydiaceae bacterium]|nr:hypothetical protein [Rhabdochlamydiaceae bacterium]